MHVFDLNYLYRSRGYVMVADWSAYHAFRPQDIENNTVKDGACPVVSVSIHCLGETPNKEICRFVEAVEQQASVNPHPYDTSTFHIVRPLEKQEEHKDKLTASWRQKSPQEVLAIIQGEKHA